MFTRTAGSTDTAASFEVGLATAFEDFDSAFRLVHDQYVARGYMAPSPTGRRLTPYHALPGTRVFIARSSSQVVGTVSLVPDSPELMPCDALYHRELAPLRAAGRRLGEVSSLAVDDGRRAPGLSIVRSLVQVVAIYASRIARVDDLCITVNPRHAKFYEALLGFQRFGAPKAYGAVRGAPAVAMRLDLVRNLSSTVSSEVFPFAAALFTRAEVARVLAGLERDVDRATVTPAELTSWAEDEMQFVQSGTARIARTPSRTARTPSRTVRTPSTEETAVIS